MLRSAVSTNRRRNIVLLLCLAALAVPAAVALHLSPPSGIHLAADESSLIDDFSDDVDGYKTVTDSGLQVDLFPTDSVRTPRVTDGRLSFDARDGVNGSYYIVEIPGVRNASVDFSFTPWSSGGGLVCLAFMEGNISLTSPVVPRSPMHFTLSPTDWSVDVFDSMGASARTVVRGSFDPPLAADGKTIHTLSVRMDPVHFAAEITLPTGEIVTSSDEAFSIPADFAYIETWRTTVDTAETLAMVSAWAADSEQDYLAPDALRALGHRDEFKIGPIG